MRLSLPPMRTASLIAALGALGLPLPAAAQTVGPPVAEYTVRAQGRFDLTNAALTPSTVVVEAFSFRVDTLGVVHYLPFDTARVKLKLSSGTVRVPARASFSVGYEASADSVPAWFVIASNFSAPRTAGLNVRIQLPHVVYLNQREALERSAVAVRAIEHDPVAKKARFKLANASGRLGRVVSCTVNGATTSSPCGSFPMFPQFWRWVAVDWPHAEPPASVRVEFERFAVVTSMTDLRRTASAP